MRGMLRSTRTGERFSYADNGSLEHHEIRLPVGADHSFREPVMLWNAAEMVERRKDSVVGREIVLALPADAEISRQDRIEMVRAFVDEHFVSKGIPVQINLH